MSSTSTSIITTTNQATIWEKHVEDDYKYNTANECLDNVALWIDADASGFVKKCLNSETPSEEIEGLVEALTGDYSAKNQTLLAWGEVARMIADLNNIEAYDDFADEEFFRLRILLAMEYTESFEDLMCDTIAYTNVETSLNWLSEYNVAIKEDICFALIDKDIKGCLEWANDRNDDAMMRMFLSKHVHNIMPSTRSSLKENIVEAIM